MTPSAPATARSVKAAAAMDPADLLPTPDGRARERLVSVILVWTLSDLVELPGGSLSYGLGAVLSR
jgi:hypothetical protein